jgi:division protein CdvB (Snf7/Vps24/ESCRT-III family)
MQNALEIQEKAEAQASVLEELNNRADEVGNNLRSVNESINTIMVSLFLKIYFEF